MGKGRIGHVTTTSQTLQRKYQVFSPISESEWRRYCRTVLDHDDGHIFELLSKKDFDYELIFCTESDDPTPAIIYDGSRLFIDSVIWEYDSSDDGLGIMQEVAEDEEELSKRTDGDTILTPSQWKRRAADARWMVDFIKRLKAAIVS